MIKIIIDLCIIALGLFGIIYGCRMDRIEEKLKKTTVPVEAKIVTAYSSLSKNSVTTDLSKAWHILVEVNSKKYKLWVREKLSRNQTEVLVYTDGKHAVMYSEKKTYISQEDKIANLMHGRMQKIIFIWSILFIALLCGEIYYNKYSKDLEALQDAYAKRIETHTNMIDAGNYTEEQKDVLMSITPIFSGDIDSVSESIMEMRYIDSRLINMGAIIEDRVNLVHPIWNSVLELHYTQIDESQDIIRRYYNNEIGLIETIEALKNTPSYGNVFLTAQIYLSILLVLGIPSFLYVTMFIIRKIRYRKSVKEFEKAYF